MTSPYAGTPFHGFMTPGNKGSRGLKVSEFPALVQTGVTEVPAGNMTNMIDLGDISTHLENRTGCSLFSAVCRHPGAQLSDDGSEVAWGLLESATDHPAGLPDGAPEDLVVRITAAVEAFAVRCCAQHAESYAESMLAESMLTESMLTAAGHKSASMCVALKCGAVGSTKGTA